MPSAARPGPSPPPPATPRPPHPTTPQDNILVDIFTDEEFDSAYRKVAVEGCLKGQGELTEVLVKVYHGEVPAAELQTFLDVTPVAEDGTITRADFDASVAKMRAMAQE